MQRQGAYAPELHLAGADRRRGSGAVDRSGHPAGRRGRARRLTAARWSRSIRRNGDVLALASKPGFDPAAFARGLTRAEYAALADDIDKPLLNRALRGTYPSGSTIKPVIALAALTDHVVDPIQPGVLRRHIPPAGQRARCFARARAGRHGRLDLQQAIATVLRRVLLRSRLDHRRRPHRRLHGALRLRRAHRHRHQRREAGAAALARVEEKTLQEPAGPGLVPRRDRQLRRRPGLPAGDPAAAGAHRLGAGRARQELPAAPGDRRCATATAT